MAVLETIRVKFGIVITALIAVALLSFIIDPQTLQQVWYSVSSKNDVGQIDSKSISYEEFQKEVDRLTSLYGARGEEQQQEINNLAWQTMINKYLFLRNANKAGINVSDAEMVSIISGDIVSPVLNQNPYFVDENGVFSVDRVLEMSKIAASDQSGQAKAFWNYVQNEVKNEMYYSKYLSLLNQSNFNNTLMAANQIAESNNSFNVEFVMVPFGFEKDSTIVVSDKEIKAYYNAHKEFYQQPASRDIEYVEFEIKPSAEDVELANNAIVKVYDEFKTTSEVKNFLARNSDRKFDENESWYKDGDLNTVSRKVNDFVFNSKQNVSEVIDDNESLFVVRVLGTKKEDGVVKKQVAIFEKAPYASEKTKSACYAKANAFAAVATGSYENFTKAVQEQGLYARPVNKMLEGTDNLGSIERTKDITRWAFDSKKGAVSEIKNIDNKYFVVAVLTGIHEEGYTPVSEVSSRIENILYSEKLADKKVAEVTEKVAGLEDMQAVAEALGTTVSTQEGVVFTTTGYQALDPKFVGAASVAEEGKISAPVAGNVGVYVYKVTGRETGSSFTEDDAKNLAAQKSYYASQMLIPTMMEDADVKDNRARFF